MAPLHPLSKAVCVVGPTCVGKTALGIRIAQALDGEVISIDSLQCYAHGGITTARPTPEETAQIPHHLTGYLDPLDEPHANFVNRLRMVVQDMTLRRKIPILVGGSTSLLPDVLTDMLDADYSVLILIAKPSLNCSSYKDRINFRVDDMVDRGMLGEIAELRRLEIEINQGDLANDRVGVWKTIAYPELRPYVDYTKLDDEKTALLERGLNLTKENSFNYALYQLEWIYDIWIPSLRARNVQTETLDISDYAENTIQSTQRFIEEYDLEVDKEFECKGVSAEWAAGQEGPRFWVEEDDAIELIHDDPVRGHSSCAALAINPDNRFLAVSTNAVIRIYAVESLEMKDEIIGHKSNINKLVFIDAKVNFSTRTELGYVLFTQARGQRSDDEIIHAWQITSGGKLADELRSKPFDTNEMKIKAMNAISDDLKITHKLTENEFDNIGDKLTKIIQAADAKNRIKHIPGLKGHFPSFGSQPISHCGRQYIYIDHGSSTQSGMRPDEELPQIVVMDIETQKERCRLRGHKDAIMWAGWSLDDKIIATACWDSSYKLWDAQTGDCKHTITEGEHQNWAGAFLPDGKHVLFSGGNPVKVAIYDLATGQEKTKLVPGATIELDHWMRYFAMHPMENLVILQNNRALLAWKPSLYSTTETTQEVEELFALSSNEECMGDRFGGLYHLRWDASGGKLLAQGYEHTIFVWDRAHDRKWRFQRPKGQGLDAVGRVNAFFLRRMGEDWIASLDGDRKVRLWKL